MSGADLIAEERARQIAVEGMTEVHDDRVNQDGELADAAQCYIRYGRICIPGDPPYDWPWGQGWWRPSGDHIRNLVKAGALIAAEIDRLQRIKEPKREE